jgi:hypothetical protein
MNSHSIKRVWLGFYGVPVSVGRPLSLAAAMGIRGKSRQELSELPPRKSLANFGSEEFKGLSD